MGGKALKNVKCVRVNANIYNTIKSTVLVKLQIYNNFIPIIETPEKETFGDLDLLYETKENQNIYNIVNEIFAPKEIIRNGDVISFSIQINEIDYFQIDLIKVSNIEMAQFYFGYGDIGNIIGFIAKKNHLTFGQEGLWITHECHKIILSKNPNEICMFLGLDYNEWLHGFENKIQIFEWIIKSKYFNKQYFTQDNYNNKQKHRLVTRPFVVEFIDYLDLENKVSQENHGSQLITDNIEYIKIFNKQIEKEIIDGKIQITKLHQEKFSGRIFLQYTDAKNINKYKEEFKKYISANQDFDNYLMENEIEYIESQIKDFIQKSNPCPAKGGCERCNTDFT